MSIAHQQSVESKTTRRDQRAAAERKRQERIAFNASTHGRTIAFGSDSRPVVAVEDTYDLEPAPPKPSEWSWDAIANKWSELMRLQGVKPGTMLLLECPDRATFERARKANVPAIEFQPLSRVSQKSLTSASASATITVKCWVYLPGLGTWTTTGKSTHHFRGQVHGMMGLRGRAAAVRTMYRTARHRADTAVRQKVGAKLAASLKAARVNDWLTRRRDDRGSSTMFPGAVLLAAAAIWLALGGHL